MRKGFTLVEMLAVVLILGVILLIGVPIYQGVQKSTNESIYNSKISNVLTKAEEYSEEHGIFIYDIRKMISLGLLTPDNEAGEFRDPRDNRSMLCDVIQVTLENGMYYANVSTGYNDDGSIHCYSDDELKSMNSIVKINFYKERDGLEQFPSGWVKANHVYAGYEFIGSPEVSNVNVTWGGVGTQLDNGRLDIYTDSLMNAEVQLHIEFDYNGKHIIQDISKNVRIDNESPRGYVTTGPGTEKSNNLSYVEWQLTDGDGSGVAGHIILDEESYRSKPCESYTVDEIPGSDQTRVGKHLNNGVYYICAKDNVGNITRNSDAEENRIEVKNVDQSSGDIESFKIESRTPPYNLKEVKLITELKDETPNGYMMCMSHTGYLENCSWEEFNSSKDYTINGYDYGSEVEFYLSVRDSAGNVSNIASTYTIDNLQYLDLNGNLNGENKSGLSGFGKCDVYVNGTKVATETNDYYQKLVPGSTYEIKNCSALSGFRYKGGSNMTGVISRSGTTGVYVPYVSLYTISYNVNGGLGSVGSQIKEHGTNINVTTAKPTRNGYTFGGWNANSSGTGANYAAGATYSGNGNATLYAKWNINSYTVTWNANSGTCSKTSSSHNYNSTLGTLPTCTRGGYNFLGWFTSTSGGTKIDTTTVVNKNITYYAQWKKSALTPTRISTLSLPAAYSYTFARVDANHILAVDPEYTSSGDGCSRDLSSSRYHVYCSYLNAKLITINGASSKIEDIGTISDSNNKLGAGAGDIRMIQLADGYILLIGASQYDNGNNYNSSLGENVTAKVIKVDVNSKKASVISTANVFKNENYETEADGIACVNSNFCYIGIRTHYANSSTLIKEYGSQYALNLDNNHKITSFIYEHGGKGEGKNCGYYVGSYDARDGVVRRYAVSEVYDSYREGKVVKLANGYIISNINSGTQDISGCNNAIKAGSLDVVAYYAQDGRYSVDSERFWADDSGRTIFPTFDRIGDNGVVIAKGNTAYFYDYKNNDKTATFISSVEVGNIRDINTFGKYTLIKLSDKVVVYTG